MAEYVPTFFLVATVAGAFVAWAAIVRKAGYSRWWLLIAFIPFVNYCMLMIFAFGDWPALRELRFQGIPNLPPNSKDGPGFLKDALKFELSGNTEEALSRYERIQEAFQGQPPGEDARISAEQLRSKIGQPGNEPEPRTTS